MADDTDALPPNRTKRIILISGIALSSLFVVFAALTIVVIKVGKVHDMWCKKVGTFCVKEVAKAAPPPPPPVPAGNCPDFKIIGSLKPRNSDDPVLTMIADVSGKVLLSQGNAAATAGKSTVACYNGQFLASFTDMSNGTTYQCQGAIDGQNYSGVCNFSDAAPHDLSGIFMN